MERTLSFIDNPFSSKLEENKILDVTSNVQTKENYYANCGVNGRHELRT